MSDRAKPYRFLLRMPEELRRDLVDASGRSERSLNAEIVRRLETSVAADERASARALTLHRVRRASVAFAATGAAAIAAALAVATESGQRSPGHVQADSAQLGQKLAQTTSVVVAPRG